jgi:glycosyltransferase involved in cell wall biosynthesis
LPEDRPIAGFVGTVYQDQGLDTVVRALARLQDRGKDMPHIFVVGGGSELESLQAMARELKVTDRITWSGQVAATEVPSAIQSCDVMLAPFPRRVFDVTGELIEPEDDEAWAKALGRLVGQVPLLGPGQGQVYVRRHHSYPAVVNRLLEIMKMEKIAK